MSKIIVETCCGSADDCIQSEISGADRVELNSALFLGGLTPSVGELETAVKSTSKIKIVTMVRPRSGGFCYTEKEFDTMLFDAENLLANGSDGIVFGFLHSDGTVDLDRCRKMMEIIGGKDAVFHRAFDVVPDWRREMEALIDLGVRRILTSGQRKNALEGKETIREMIEYAAGRIEILPGAGIRDYNVRELIDFTGCSQVHMSKRKKCDDMSVCANKEICFGNPAAPEEFSFEMIDSVGLKKVIIDLNSSNDS